MRYISYAVGGHFISMMPLLRKVMIKGVSEQETVTDGEEK